VGEKLDFFRFADELRLLVDMGFDNVDGNLALLEQEGGDIDKVVQRLLVEQQQQV
jgi:hypothetical protein